jgi:hypothetical protein
MRDPAHFGGAKGHDAAAVEQAMKAAADADRFPPAVVGGEDGGTDDGIETRGVAAAG